MHAMTLPHLCIKNSVVTEFTKVTLTIPESVLKLALGIILKNKIKIRH